ncbi:hypothetical protein MASR2M48_06690 [Spirochaetota bacterium]
MSVEPKTALEPSKTMLGSAQTSIGRQDKRTSSILSGMLMIKEGTTLNVKFQFYKCIT